jgi:RNA 3'-terminal phosphate cyclase (ATP)
MDILDIDGNYGEGGGQILRSSLALSAILNRPICINRIRAGRKSPGLAPQHLTSVNAVAAITNAEVIGGAIGSETVTFRPHEIRGGNYTFDVADIRPSAGALSLVFQSIAWPLSYAKVPSTVTLRGGTHVPWSPTVHYLQEVFVPIASKFGFDASIQLNRWGWYPKGGGEVVAKVYPTANCEGITLAYRGKLQAVHGISAASNLPEHIINRQHNQIQKRLAQLDSPVSIERIRGESTGQGTFVFLKAEFENVNAGFSALGARGKRAESVADEACQALETFLASDAAIEPHLADQLILPMALAAGESRFTTSLITRHLTTNIWLIEQFLPVRFEVSGAENEPGEVVKVDY